MNAIEPTATGFRRRLAWRRWTREVRPTLALAFPIMSGMVGHMVLGLADTLMVGRVGVVPLAAASLVNAVTHLPMIFFIGLLSSLPVLASQAYGARDYSRAGQVLRHGLLAALGSGCLCALGLAMLRPGLAWLGQPPEVVEEAQVYMLLFGGSMLPLLVLHAAKQYTEALNHPWVPTLIVLLGVVLNIFLNWILIYGNWGAPAMGLNGAGWATLIARLLTAGGVLGFLLMSPTLRRALPPRWGAALERKLMGRLLTLGWPVAVQHLLEISAFVFAGVMMGWISAESMAAHQIALTCASTTFMFPFGIGMAVCIRVGHAWGSGQWARTSRIGMLGIGMAVGVMGCFALVLMLAARPIAQLFVESSEVILLATQLLMIAAVFQVADGIQVVANSALRGLTDVRVPALMALMAYWVIALPVAYLLAFHSDYGSRGIWIGLALGLGLAALLLSVRFYRLSCLRTR